MNSHLASSSYFSWRILANSSEVACLASGPSNPFSAFNGGWVTESPAFELLIRLAGPKRHCVLSL